MVMNSPPRGNSVNANANSRVIILSVALQTVFMLDPDMILLVEELRKRGYITGEPNIRGEAIIGIFVVEASDVIARKGGVRVYYNFGRRTLGIQSSSNSEVLGSLKEVDDALRSIGVDRDEALIPYELAAIAQAELAPKFAGRTLGMEDVLGFDLNFIGAYFARLGGDPNSRDWFHVSVQPIYSSYRPGRDTNPYRLTLTYRSGKEDVLKMIRTLPDVLGKICEKV